MTIFMVNVLTDVWIFYILFVLTNQKQPLNLPGVTAAISQNQGHTIMLTPATSAIAAQLAAHYQIMNGWDNSQAIAEAIENNDSEELIRLCRGLSPKAIEIIDRLLQVTVNRRNLRHA